MIKFSKNIIRSFNDLPNNISLIVHSIGCNLKCYDCFNYDELVSNPKDICDSDYILKEINMNGYLSDAVIISGGEFLYNNINEIIDFLAKLKETYNGIIIINTNGSFPHKMRKVIDCSLSDGFHTDLKLPYYTLNKNSELYNIILGQEVAQNTIKKLIKSVKITIMSDRGYSQIRSVRYPILDDSVYEDNIKYIDELNKRFGKNTPYYINEFYPKEK